MKFEFIEENSEFNDKYIFTGEALSDVIFFMNSFRNICAHNERLYDYKFTSDDININKFIVHEYYNLDFKYSLFDLILVLKFFISQLEYKAMISLIASCLAFLSENIDENNFEYTSSSGLTEDIDRLVQKLKRTINKQSDIQGSRINHYTTNYNTVPFWVLMPQLDFGTTAYFFKCS